MEDFGERGMDMNGLGKVAECGPAMDECRCFLYDIRRMCSHCVASYNPTICMSQQFHQSIGSIHGQSLTIGAVVGLAADIVAIRLLFQLVFGGPYASHFGIGEDRCGHGREVNIILFSQYVINGTDALEGGGMSQHLKAVDIADGVDRLRPSKSP